MPEYKEAFALFDKRGTGAVPRETLGDLLRALGQNPTQAEVAEIVAGCPRDGACLYPHTGIRGLMWHGDESRL
jgi:Ca2+-binding EF-hand superfamily protein